MEYGICLLSIVPMRSEPSHKAEMVSQIVFGELFTVLESNASWSRVKLDYDAYEGWIDKKQGLTISAEEYIRLKGSTVGVFDALDQMIFNKHMGVSITIPMGSIIHGYDSHQFESANTIFTFSKAPNAFGKPDLSNIESTAMKLLNRPYLWGGKTPYGIDCSGFTQLIYKLCGVKIPRDASQQALLGTNVDFVLESMPGDLAFFENMDGHVVHTGIIINPSQIIHASAMVRIDHLDHEGIFDASTKQYSHKLKIIKRIVAA